MTWMNRYDVEETAERTRNEETPVAQRGAQILLRLMQWTDSNSDGWPYWQKPSKAASNLMDHLKRVTDSFRRDPVDMTEAELNRALTPIKAFLTRQGVDEAVRKEILEGPPKRYALTITVDERELHQIMALATKHGVTLSEMVKVATLLAVKAGA